MRIVRLTDTYQIKPFDCGDEDLNDFLFNSSKNYQEQLLAVTYIWEDEVNTIAFFSLLNDKVSVEQFEKARWRFLRKTIPHKKHLMSYPAVKIGRLAVSNAYKGNDYGTDILNYLKKLFVTNNRTGCKFLTVDAYAQSLGFYEKNNFRYFREDDKDQDTRQMYFPLSTISNQEGI
jgi:predicted GNAT family N-acyltransferase